MGQQCAAFRSVAKDTAVLVQKIFDVPNIFDVPKIFGRPKNVFEHPKKFFDVPTMFWIADRSSEELCQGCSSAKVRLIEFF